MTLAAIADWARGLDGMNRWEQPYVVLSLCRVLRTLSDGGRRLEGPGGGE